MTLLDFLSQHTGLLYWAMMFSFIGFLTWQFIKTALVNMQKFPDPGTGNTYVTNNYWPGGPGEFVQEEAIKGEGTPIETADTKDML